MEPRDLRKVDQRKERPQNSGSKPGRAGDGGPGRNVKFEVFGEEILEKTVSKSGKSGRVYLPLVWLGKNVKVIRLN